MSLHSRSYFSTMIFLAINVLATYNRSERDGSDNGVGQEREEPDLGVEFQSLRRCSTRQHLFHTFADLRETDYFLFTAGCVPATNIGVNCSVWASLTNGCSTGKAVRFCSIYLAGRLTMVGKCQVKPLLTIGSDDNCTLGTVWPRHWCNIGLAGTIWSAARARSDAIKW